MRFTRLIIGSLIIILAIIVIAGEQLAGTSVNAVVNARLTTVRTAIAGELTLRPRELGSRVATGESIGATAGTLLDGNGLDDLIRERSRLHARTTRLEKTVRAIETSLEGLQLRSQSFRQERVRQLVAELEHARSQISAEEVRLEEAQAAFGRSRKLSGREMETSAAVARARANQRIAELDLEAARQRAATIEIALEAAKRGTFLGNGYNDAPYSEQRISELSLRLSELQADVDAEQAEAEALDERIGSERLRVNRLTSANLKSNVDGLVWEILAAHGEYLQRSQDIMRLVDCRSTVITLSVSESLYNRLKPGDAATFRVSSDGRTFAGIVTRLAGAGAQTIYRNLAIAPGEQHLEHYDVTVLSKDLRSDPDFRCAVGRTGRVFFETRPLDFLRRFWN